MDIFNEVNRIEDHYDRPIQVESYVNENGQTSEYTFDTKKQIAIITFFSASRFLSGNSDALGIKPFYNIVNQVVDLEVRATDIDTASIMLRAVSPEYEIQALLASKALHNYFEDINFAKILNKFGETGSRYGNALFKRSYVNGEMQISVPNWSTMTFDQFDIDNGVKIERHQLSPLDLEKKRGIWDDEAIDEAIKYLRDTEKDEDVSDYLEVLEVEGEFFNDIFTGEDDSYGSSLQHWFVANVDKLQLVFFKEQLKESNYLYYGRKELDGRGWSLGVVEQGQEAQIEANLHKLFERRSAELASKKLYLTTDEKFKDDNALVDRESGDFLYVDLGKDVRELSTISNALPMFENMKNSWVENFKASLSAFDSVTGDNLPSGTAYRLGLLQAKQASSMFKYLRQGKANVVKQMIKKWILPELVKKINKDFILEAGFSPKELDLIQEKLAISEANVKVKELLERGMDIDGITYEEMIQEAKDALPKKANQFLQVEKGLFKDLLNKVRVVVDDEAEEVDSKIATLEMFLQVAQNDPTGAIFGEDGAKNIVAEISRLQGLSLLDYGLTGGSKKAPAQIQVPEQGLTPQANEQSGAVL